MPEAHDETFLPRVGEAIRARRTELRMTQDQLADKTSTQRSSIGGIERGEINPTLITLQNIAIAMEIRLTDLLADPERATEPFVPSWRHRKTRSKPQPDDGNA